MTDAVRVTIGSTQWCCQQGWPPWPEVTPRP